MILFGEDSTEFLTQSHSWDYETKKTCPLAPKNWCHFQQLTPEPEPKKCKNLTTAVLTFLATCTVRKKTFSFYRSLYVCTDWSTGFGWFGFLEIVTWLLRVLFLQHFLFRLFARLGVLSTPASLVNLECSLHITKHFFSSDNKFLAELILELWIETVHVLLYVAEGTEFLFHISSTSAISKMGYLQLGRKHISS